jgi:polyferredoxin/tetratricopeptide (TPR) repeat protein
METEVKKGAVGCEEGGGVDWLREGEFSGEMVKRGRVKRSKMGKRRAWVLVLVHVAIFAHILHWKLKGETLTPLEPSEAMYTLATGAVNAGAILLLISLGSSLVLGRWFCGWACHLVALQDLCAWMLKKVGIHPKPLRSRWLMWVPLLAGIHLFFFPVFVRWAHKNPAPPWVPDFFKSEFWETFPGPMVATLTFLLTGFGMVYLLGAKGFCTYACPYGGLFGVVEPFAPLRIRVTDACKGCGHCSAVCTSNVLVHKEVHEFGMVVDPGCMKCLDCVSTCPENALYLGFGRPAIAKKARIKHLRPKAWSFSGKEELALVAVFVVTLFILRGLPEPIVPWAGALYLELTPLLFALGIAAVTAFSMVLLWRLVRRPELKWQSYVLKAEGVWRRSGVAFASVTALLLLFLVHSAWIQSLMWRVSATVQDTPPSVALAAWRQDPSIAELHTAGYAEDARRALAHLDSAEAYGLMEDIRIPRERAWLLMTLGDSAGAEAALRAAIELRPHWGNSYQHLGQLLASQGDERLGEAAMLLRKAEEQGKAGQSVHESIRELVARGQIVPAHAVMKRILEATDLSSEQRETYEAQRQSVLATALAAADQGVMSPAYEAAVDLWAKLLPEVEGSPLARDYFRVAGGWAKKVPEVVGPLRRAYEAQPTNAGLETVFAQSLIATGSFDEAATVTERMVAKWPDDAISAYLMGQARRGQGREQEALQWFDKAHARNSTLPKDGR